MVVVDGVFLLRRDLRSLWDLSVHLHVPEEETLRRVVLRDAVRMGSAAEVERRYRARYLPAQSLYRQEADPLAAADVVVDNTDPAAPLVLSGQWMSRRANSQVPSPTRARATAPRNNPDCRWPR